MSIHFLSDKDVVQVLDIELLLHENPWGRTSITKHMRDSDSICLVDRDGDIVRGYAIFVDRQNRFDLARMVVHPDNRRRKVGTGFIERMTSRMTVRRPQIVCEVREYNYPAQLFLRSCGFRAIETLKNIPVVGAPDIYLMVLSAACKSDVFCSAASNAT